MCLIAFGLLMLRGAARSSSPVFSLCHVPLLKPRNAAPLNTLPPSFSTLFMRMPPPDVSAGIALVMIVISDCSMSSKYACDAPSRL